MKSQLYLIFLIWAASGFGHPEEQKAKRIAINPAVDCVNANSSKYDDCGSIVIGELGDGSVMTCYNVDFGTGANNMIVDYSNNAEGTKFTAQVKIDDLNNPETFLSLSFGKTDTWCDFRQIQSSTPSTTIPTGIHNIYFIFSVDNESSEGLDVSNFVLFYENSTNLLQN
ncbi:hypothetical protein CHUAL_008829 [Chamberlinius hualienensis]